VIRPSVQEGGDEANKWH